MVGTLGIEPLACEAKALPLSDAPFQPIMWVVRPVVW